MKLSNINESLSLIANLGVILGIVILAAELGQQNQSIDQSNRIAQSTALADLSARGVEFFGAAVSDPALADLILKLQDRENLTRIETTPAFFLAGQLVQIWYSAEDYFNNGLIDETAYSGFLEAPQGTIAALPGIAPFVRAQFSSGLYQNRIGSRMNNHLQTAIDSI